MDLPGSAPRAGRIFVASVEIEDASGVYDAYD